jgi:ubiquinone/menaquinone biosynthesis C-methylase UbiE
MTNLWDKISKPYLKGLKADTNADFAYEKLVNSLAILSWCTTTGNVLDLGCGDGRFTKDLEARFDRVYAVDFSDNMLKEAKKLCKATKFFNCNLEDDFPKFDIKFDAIICKLLLMYIRNLNNIAANSYRYLCQNGFLIISVTHPLKWLTQANYQGYLHESEIKYPIANIHNTEIEFSSRTIQSYINTFTKYGFVLETVTETGVPDSFVIKYPQYRPFQYKPYRLNLKFVKK